MSLRTFHIVFVLVSTLMTFGVGVWAVSEYRANQDNAMLVLTGICSACVVGLLLYGRWFMRKLKDAPF